MYNIFFVTWGMWKSWEGSWRPVTGALDAGGNARAGTYGEGDGAREHNFGKPGTRKRRTGENPAGTKTINCFEKSIYTPEAVIDVNGVVTGR